MLAPRFNAFDDLFHVHREVDRLFNAFWSDLANGPAAATPNFQVRSTDDAWKIAVPMPGIDPQHVNLEVAGSTLRIRAEQPQADDTPVTRFEQTITLPNFLDVDKLRASHRHGLLELMVPFKESVKPRRVQIEAAPSETRQITAVA